jgi:hypothetical protein
MNARGWLEGGARMVESFVANWPSECLPLILYAEDFAIPEMSGVEVRALPGWIAEFKERWGKTPAYNGHRAGGYDYRFDAVKFAHKIAALTDAGLRTDADVLVWIDADTFTHSKVTAERLEGMLPAAAYMAWLDRMRSHPESGFMMFRCAHNYHQNFMEALRNLYTTGDLFKLRETHDAFAIQNTVQAKVIHGKIPVPVSLSGAGFRTSHPFVNGPLGEIMDHCKGPLRKANGRSHKRDLIIPRDHPYWNAAQ